MLQTESSKRSAEWVGDNIDRMKLQNTSDPISLFIERQKKKEKPVTFSVEKENYIINEGQ